MQHHLPLFLSMSRSPTRAACNCCAWSMERTVTGLLAVPLPMPPEGRRHLEGLPFRLNQAQCPLILPTIKTSAFTAMRIKINSHMPGGWGARPQPLGSRSSTMFRKHLCGRNPLHENENRQTDRQTDSMFYYTHH